MPNSTREILLLVSIIAVLFTACMVIILGVAIPNLRSNKNKKKKSQEEAKDGEEEPIEDDAELSLTEIEENYGDTFHATVIDQLCGAYSAGDQNYKQPKAVKSFLIKFRDDAGSVHDVFVSEEIYFAIEVGQSGILTLIDGRLSSFVLDEE